VPLPWGAEVKNLFLSNSFCTCSSVFALFTNGHVELVTGSESSTYWSWAVLWKKTKGDKFCDFRPISPWTLIRPAASASEVTTVWRYRNSIIIIINLSNGTR